MNICPICLFVNSAEAASCTRCQKHSFTGGAVAVMEAPLHAQIDHNLPQSSRLGDQSTIRSETGLVYTKSSGALRFEQALRAAAANATPPPRDGVKSIKIALIPKLEVVRGEKLGTTFQILEGKNVLGRTVNQPVDIDLTGQEPVERVWTSRQHSCIHFDGRTVTLEDLNSLNGTFVNRTRMMPGQQRILNPNDIIQVGTVQLKYTISAEKAEEKF